MFRAETGNRWLSRYGFNMMADFCVWVLEKDGLQAPPFDAHPDGDGTLRSAGLQAQEWKLWTAQVIQLQDQEFQTMSQHLKVGMDPSPFFIADAHNPPASWPGNVAVRKRLDTLWEQYGPLSNERSKWERPLAKQRRPMMHQLWNDLQPYHTRIPALMVHLIKYPKQVEYIIPPVSVILTVADDHMDNETFRLRILHAAESLARAQQG
jgi:hypothetical protein